MGATQAKRRRTPTIDREKQEETMQSAMEDMLESFIESKMEKTMLLLKKTVQGFEHLSGRRCIRLQKLLRDTSETLDRPYTNGIARYSLFFDHLRLIRKNVLMKLEKMCCNNPSLDTQKCTGLVEKLREKERELSRLYEDMLGVEWVIQRVKNETQGRWSPM
jgi:hypothetical protein